MGKKEKKDKGGKTEKEEKVDKGEEAGPSYEERKKFINVIAKPLADEKLCKKTLKLAKKAAKKKLIKRGVKEVVKAVRKNVKGVCILAGDISPIDVITHIPVVCEESGVPYIYVPSKEELGAAALSKRPTSCMLVLPRPLKGGEEVDEEYSEAYGQVEKKIKAAQVVF